MTTYAPDQMPDIARQYILTFAARTDAYAKWVGDHWMCVREELTPDALLSAFDAKAGLSTYTIDQPRWDGTWHFDTHIAAVDFDTPDGWDLARRLRDTMWERDVRAYISPSRRGAHLWVVMKDQLPARVVRRALRGFLAAALIAEHPKIELRPAQDEIKPDGFGNPIRLPTMHHPKTGTRYPLCGPDDQSIGTTLADIVLNVSETPPQPVADMAARTPARVSDLDPSYLRPRVTWRDNEEGSASDLLTTLWGAQKAAPGRTIKCPAHQDDVPSLSILKDDQRAVCHSPSCDLHNGGRGRGIKELSRMAGRPA